MAMFMRVKVAIASLTVVFTMFAGAAMAQQSQPNTNAPAQTGPQTRHPRMRHGRMPGIARAFRQLNLTDQQRQQIHSIMQTQFQNTQSQRQELGQLMPKRRAGTLTPDEAARAKELRRQLMQAEQGLHAQVLAVLTPEQKAQLQEIIKTRRENRGKLGPGKQPIT
jgi:Spy/CpxP family protein refolding chaperone